MLWEVPHKSRPNVNASHHHWLLSSDGSPGLVLFLHTNKSMNRKEKKKALLSWQGAIKWFGRLCSHITYCYFNKGELYMPVMVKANIDWQSEEIWYIFFVLSLDHCFNRKKKLAMRKILYRKMHGQKLPSQENCRAVLQLQK